MPRFPRSCAGFFLPWVLLALALVVTACAAPPGAPKPSRTQPGPGTVIFVTSNGWHSGIVLAKADLPSGRLPETADFPDARFLEFGWGDAVYYPAKQPTISMTLGAALVPTPAVVHVAGLWAEPARVYPKAEVLALPIDHGNLRRLVDFIHASFARGGAPRAAATGPGLYASSRFYPATGSFHLFNTCNTWTARGLASAGFDIDAAGISRAEPLMQQLRVLAGTR